MSYSNSKFEKVANKNKPKGYAGLDKSGKIPFSEIDSFTFENYIKENNIITSIIFS